MNEGEAFSHLPSNRLGVISWPSSEKPSRGNGGRRRRSAPVIFVDASRCQWLHARKAVASPYLASNRESPQNIAHMASSSISAISEAGGSPVSTCQLIDAAAA